MTMDRNDGPTRTFDELTLADHYLRDASSTGLRELVEKSIRTGEPVSLKDLSNVAIRKDGWNGLNSDVIRKVLSKHLDVRGKIVLGTKVCKAWNQAFQFDGSMFSDLTDDSMPGNAKDLDELVTWLKRRGLINSVTSIRIATVESDGDGCLDDLLANLPLSKIRHIHLSGQWIDRWSISRANGLGPSLESLVVDRISRAAASDIQVQGPWWVDSDDTDDSDLEYDGGEGGDEDGADSHLRKTTTTMTTLLHRSRKLRRIEIPVHLLSSSGLAHTLGGIGPPRITPTNLIEINLMNQVCDSIKKREDLGRICWADIAVLARYCPKLEVLELPAVFEGGNGYEDDDELGAFGGNVKMKTLRNLRVCKIDTIIISYELQRTHGTTKAYSTESVGRIINWLLNGMPMLEEFSFGHGQTDGQPPRLSENCLVSSSRLRKLHLKDFCIMTPCLISSGIDGDEVESIVLEMCVGRPSDALEEFKLRFGIDAEVEEKRERDLNRTITASLRKNDTCSLALGMQRLTVEG